jgi:CelD/BcsL family acetyltransferase involved in cellulose biosynthesis
MEACGGEKGSDVAKYLRPLIEIAAPPLLRDGRMQLWMLHLNGQIASSLLQIPTPAGPMLYNCGYDPAQKKWSPGIVAVATSIRNAIAAGATTYDLLRGQEPYKYRLGAVDRALVRITLKRK